MGLARVTRFTDYLHRTFNTKGREEPMSVIPDVFPGIPLIDPTDVEHHFTRNEVLWQVSNDVAAGGAGTYARLEVGCNQRMVTVIEAVAVTIFAGAANFLTRIQTSAPSGAPNLWPTRCDSRAEVAGPPPGAYCYSAAVAAVVAANLGAFSVLANSTVIFPVGVVIDSDDIWMVGCATANVRAAFTVFGYDRPAEDWERG